MQQNVVTESGKGKTVNLFYSHMAITAVLNFFVLQYLFICLFLVLSKDMLTDSPFHEVSYCRPSSLV
jgi:hypothetical protein